MSDRDEKRESTQRLRDERKALARVLGHLAEWGGLSNVERGDILRVKELLDPDSPEAL